MSSTLLQFFKAGKMKAYLFAMSICHVLGAAIKQITVYKGAIVGNNTYASTQSGAVNPIVCLKASTLNSGFFCTKA